ncbi:MAG: lytic transglycosylase domain-containing protein [Paracoccaceae bacterium]|nr:lytic transglycosylase domain-containing protein [Paracoccaceae bacterium]
MRIIKTMILVILLSITAQMTAAQGNAASRDLARAMQDMRSGDWNSVKMPRDRLARALVDWHRLRDQHGQFSEYVAFMQAHPIWPGMPLLQKRGEQSIKASTPARDVIAYFENQKPRTAYGALKYAQALTKSGRTGDAGKAILDGWENMNMDAALQAQYLAEYPKTLRKAHERRLDNLLWAERLNEATRMFDLVSTGWQKLARARIGLRRKENGVDAMIAAVPASLADDGGMAYERFIWRMTKGRYSDAATLIIAQSKAKKLGKPEVWGPRRRNLARQLMRDGQVKTAYQVASIHGLTEGSDFADLEWLAGYISLRKLNRPGPSLDHFARHQKAVASPISLSRAGYWIGRAYEAMGDNTQANRSFTAAAEHQSAFYGQLAAEKMGIATDPALLGKKRYPGWESASFVKTESFRGGLLWLAAGEQALARRWFVHLCERLTAHEMGQLADLAFDLGQPNIALMVAKYAARENIVLQRAYYPVTNIAKLNLPAPTELNLSIARRESEFDPTAQSGAGARGLMQVMPGTAKLMAKETGQPYQLSRLTSDGDYNASLGSAYLQRLIKEFGYNLPLVTAGYNAGPGRPRGWIGKYGDPRSRRVDVVDWIEHVPFNETRNYIMRASESVPIYRMRLKGKVENFRLSQELKAN